MSSVAIQGNAAGAGVFTIASPNSASSYTATLPQQTGTLVAGTSTANAVIPAGTTAIAPVLFTSGTNLTSATAGAMEYDGKVIYATPQGTQRGIVPGMQFYRLNSDLAGANATGAQSIYGVSVTLSASTVYEFFMYYILSKSAGTTSNSMSLGFGGTVTINNILYGGASNSDAVAFTSGQTTGASTFNSNTLSATTIIGASASAGRVVQGYLCGTVSVNAGGTFIPQYTLSAAPGGAFSTLAGSFIKIYPVGASGANVNVGTWA
jgi:hypothetical protein